MTEYKCKECGKTHRTENYQAYEFFHMGYPQCAYCGGKMERKTRN